MQQKNHRKFKEPLQGKGFRTLLQKAGCSVFLVDEFRTSCQCSHCQAEEANKPCIKLVTVVNDCSHIVCYARCMKGGMAWHGMVWHGMAGMAWHVMV